MSQLNIFERASRIALRFNSTKGRLSVEDLWALPLTSRSGVSLDSVAIAANRELKELEEESFVATPSLKNADAQLRMDIVKHIIEVRIAERDEKKLAAVKAERKEKILEILARKDDDALAAKSPEELRKELENL